MARIRLLAISTALVVAMTCLAQQPNTPSATSDKQQNTLPSLDDQMKTLTAKLDLTRDQQSKIKPIMRDLHNFTQKVMQDAGMTREQQLAAVRPRRSQAATKIRKFLSEEQNKKFDAYIGNPHAEAHGSLSGGPTAQH